MEIKKSRRNGPLMTVSAATLMFLSILKDFATAGGGLVTQPAARSLCYLISATSRVLITSATAVAMMLSFICFMCALCFCIAMTGEEGSHSATQEQLDNTDNCRTALIYYQHSLRVTKSVAMHDLTDV